MIQINNFRKTYDGRIALRVDQFTIPPGIYWVRGINGSGKSTLLKAMAGIASFQGDILLHGKLNSKQQSVAYRKAVNFAEAEPVFPEFLTGTELIRLFEKAKSAPNGQADFYVDSMGMAAYLPDPVGTYSSGMIKKLSLLLAFLGQPACILLDEPLTTLDADSLPVLYAWIARQHHQYQTTFLLSSHQEFEGEILPDVRTIVVEQGTIRYKL